MQAGKLRHRVAIDIATETKGASGQMKMTWTLTATAWAAIEPMRGSERVYADAETAEMDTVITMRYLPQFDAVSTKWRIRHRNVIYDIKSVANVNMRDREIEVLAQSGVNRG
jgi:SPP1 family predicted phage head-tail adaptor